MTRSREGRQRMSTPPSDAVSRLGDTGDPGLRACVAYVLGQICLPCEMAVDLPTAGKLLVRPRLVERRWCAAGLDSGSFVGEAIALTCAGQPAVLLVERRTAGVVVNAVMGVPPPSLAGPLSRIERGVLEGTIATILARLGQTGILGLRGGASDSLPPGSLAIAISIGLHHETGHAWLVASDASLERLWTTRDTSGDDGPPWLEVARTRVPGREMGDAEVGDVLVFEEIAALSSMTLWPARVLWRGKGLPVQWSGDGLVAGLEGSAGEPDAQTRVERRPSAKEYGATGGEEDSWVEVSAGVECDLMRYGSREHFVVPRGDQIRIKVGGRCFGLGSVTQQDGAFAVAITRIVSG